MPYFGSTVFIASIVCLFLLSLAGAISFTKALLGKRLEHASSALERRPLGSTVVGLVLGLVSFLLFAVLTKGGGGAKLLATLVAAAFVASALVGLTVVASHLGARMPTPADEASPHRQTLRGALVLELASIFPVFGWFLVFPVSIASGLGAIVIGALKKKTASAPLAAFTTHGFASPAAFLAAQGIAPPAAFLAAQGIAPPAWEPGSHVPR